jgi:hypothetical protein
MYNQHFPNVHDHISNLNGIDINLAKWILRLQIRMESLETREKKRHICTYLQTKA